MRHSKHSPTALINKIRRLPPPELPDKGYGPFRFVMPENIVVFGQKPPGEGDLMKGRFVLFLSIKGRLAITLDGTLFQLAPMHALLGFPDQQCRMASPPGHANAWMIIAFESRNTRSASMLRNQAVALSRRAVSCLDWLCDLHMANVRNSTIDPNQYLLLTSLLLMELVFAAGDGSRTHARHPARHPLYSDLMAKVSYYVYRFIQKPFRLSDVAGHVGVSPSHLSAVFKRETGQTIGHFIRRRKIVFGARLLDSTAKSVAEIAAWCGFESAYSFSRSFKKTIGTSPLAYRRRHLATHP